MVERKFHAIGHGGFITERINNVIDIVYDCGTDTNMTNLESKIDSHFSENTEINALFISHFHRDHINGIEHLLTNRRITNLILPLMDNVDRIFYLRSQNISHESFMGRLILDPISLVDDYEIRNIVQVSSREGHGNLRPILLEELSHNSTIVSGTPISINSSLDWVYKSFNYQGDRQWRNWRNSLSGIVIPGNSINLATYSSLLRQIDQALQTTRPNGTINRDHYNRHSMVLYSGPLEENINLEEGINDSIVEHYENPMGALYFGDYLAGQSRRWRNLTQNYNDVWNNIKIVQVTHHGSGRSYFHNHQRRNNNNNSLYSIIDRAIIFAENGMRNGNLVHPSLVVTNYFNRIQLNYNVMLTRNQDEVITCHI